MERVSIKTIMYSVILVFAILFASVMSYGQATYKEVSDEAWMNAKNLVLHNVGSQYRLTDVIEVDSSIGNKFIANGQIEDPYQTLKGKILFVAGRSSLHFGGEPRGVFGVIDVSGIRWRSDSVIANFQIGSTRIIKSADINNDGKIDIVISRKDESGNYENAVWIFSWDGTTGSLINAVDEKGESLVHAQTGADPDFVDTNGDGVDEIVLTTYPEDTKPSFNTVFAWNGTVYDKQPTQPSPDQFLPRNLLSASIKSSVGFDGNRYTYSYVVRNQESSKQKIDEVMIGTSVDSVGFSYTSPNKWVAGGRKDLCIGWRAVPLFDLYILPGKSKSEFSLSTSNLPALVKFYIRGKNHMPPTERPTLEQVEAYYQDMLTNSFITSSVGPSKFNSTFSNAQLCDTLMSYTNQSLALGWLVQKKDLDISDGESNKESIATNLIRRLQAIKSTLQQGDSISARSLLQKFVDKVEAEHARSANRMSDECYALLKYNGEYLRDRLPSQ